MSRSPLLPAQAACRRRRHPPASCSSRLSSSDSAISRCCAPSCRFRSRRCRSFWPTSMMRARTLNSTTCARSSACSRPFSRPSPARQRPRSAARTRPPTPGRAGAPPHELPLVDAGGGRAAVRVGQLDEAAVTIRVAAVVREPVGQCEGRVAESAREPREGRPAPDPPGARQRDRPRTSGPREWRRATRKRDRRQAERGERRPPDLLHRGTAPGSRHEECSDHDEREPECVGEKRERPAQLPAIAQPPGDQDAHTVRQ